MFRALLILVLLSAVVAFFGKDRKFGFWGYFFCSLILTPIVGALLVVASDRRATLVVTPPLSRPSH